MSITFISTFAQIMFSIFILCVCRQFGYKFHFIAYFNFYGTKGWGRVGRDKKCWMIPYIAFPTKKQMTMMGNTKSMTQLCDNFDGNKYDTQMTQVCHNYDTIHTFTAFNFISQSENLNALHHQ